MRHAKAMAVVVAYDIYLEVAEGELNEEWGLREPMDFWRLREKLSRQMLRYKSTARRYPGDDRMRMATQQSKKKRKLSELARKSDIDNDDGVSKRDFVMNTKGAKCRLVGDLTTFQKHFDSIKMGRKHPNICVVCGDNVYSLCQLCGKAMLR